MYKIVIVGLMIGVVVLAGCKKDYEPGTLLVQIDNGWNNIDDVALPWHNNDLVWVNNQSCTTSAAHGLSAKITDVVEADNYRAIYPADILGKKVDISGVSNIYFVKLPREQQYEVDDLGEQKVKVPMGAFSSNKSLKFHNLCSLIKVVITNRRDEDVALGRITVTAGTAYISGQSRASVTGSQNDYIYVVSPIVATAVWHDVSLVFPTANRPIIGNGSDNSYVYYIVVPKFDEDDVTITLFSTNGRSATFEKRMSVQLGRIETVSLTVDKWDGEDPPDPPSVDGVLSGAFSVSKIQRVFFSQGNLQYQASTDTWRFAEHQYDYVGNNNSNISPTYSGWIDLFGWGTGNNPTLASEDPSYYPIFADWGNNAIINGGNTAGSGWRTLTSAEWEYLLNTRISATSKRGTGNINGVGGLIILPDWWTLPAGCTFTPGFSEYEVYRPFPDWTRNSYTLTQWAAMEAAGAVFLPAADNRSGTSVMDCNQTGNYWSSTKDDYYESAALGLIFYDYYILWRFDECPAINRRAGCSVRLVR